MDTIYQRSMSQEASLCYEHKKHGDALPLVGVNTFLAEGYGWRRRYRNRADPLDPRGEGQICIQAFRARRQDKAEVGTHLQAPVSLSALQATARDPKNVFAALMEAVKAHSLGQISHALYGQGGSAAGICNESGPVGE